MSASSSLPVIDSPYASPDGDKTSSVVKRVVLVGNPNAGKTSLFNRLTGLRAQTANFAGTTVEHRRARIEVAGQPIELIDLPGLYSLDAATLDEKIACEVLQGDRGRTTPDAMVLVVDATNLQRHLFLASQLIELAGHTKRPMIVALNMVDLADKQGTTIDVDRLAKNLDCPIVRVSARTGSGLDELLAAVAGALGDPVTPQAETLCHCTGCSGCSYSQRHDWALNVTRASTSTTDRALARHSESIDRWMTHPILGLAAFAGVMFFTFWLIYSLATYPMDGIEAMVSTAGDLLARWIPAGDFRSLLVDGVVGGVGGVLVFLPQICLLFFMLALLEDSGYLSRAAFVMDRLMRKVGLPGKAFVPMLSAHACAIPAIMATRVIEDRRDRLVTILVLPLMTCSARVPVYALLIALLFANDPIMAGAVFTGAYALGIVAALAMAWIFKRTLLRGESQPLLIELPDYKRPSIRNALLTTYDRSMVFIKNAGGTILLISIVLWAAATYPKTSIENLPVETQTEIAQLEAADDTAAAENLLAEAQLENSIAGRLGRGIQPVLAPLGFDWKMSVGVVTSFAAREVIVSTLSILYGLGEEGDEAALTDKLRAAETARGERAFDTPTCLSLLVFYVLAMQCLPTQVITKRETGSWGWAAFQFAYMTVLAYVAALVTYQVASAVVV